MFIVINTWFHWSITSRPLTGEVNNTDYLVILAPVSGWGMLWSKWTCCPQIWCVRSTKNGQAYGFVWVIKRLFPGMCLLTLRGMICEVTNRLEVNPGLIFSILKWGKGGSAILRNSVWFCCAELEPEQSCNQAWTRQVICCTSKPPTR